MVNASTPPNNGLPFNFQSLIVDLINISGQNGSYNSRPQQNRSNMVPIFNQALSTFLNTNASQNNYIPGYQPYVPYQQYYPSFQPNYAQPNLILSSSFSQSMPDSPPQDPSQESQASSSSDYKPYYCSSDDPTKPPEVVKKLQKCQPKKDSLTVPMKRGRPSKKDLTSIVSNLTSATQQSAGPLDNLPSVHCEYFSAFAPANLDPTDMIAASQNTIPFPCAYCSLTHL